ncbi:hypothetical protein Cgig2_033433 [Carnegiea gigantea]|uniref:Uncharacterized protein n=1 Tax=Carnegiea gigantea TaxID=171969 RepID=A0A9Q1QQB2_9CARY|nr:hypothetical protein Cgig2_033433 [Carnegiea gigantea]
MICTISTPKVAEGLTVEGVLENWVKLKPVVMEEWSEDRDTLIELFGKHRDEWIEKDLASWIGANRFYPGVTDALRFSSSKIYIVTTKQVEVLKKLQRQPEHRGLNLHFVEDRLATLKNVTKEPELDGWNLYLVNWGYNTQKEREEAATIPRIRVLELPEFIFKNKESSNAEEGYDGILEDFFSFSKEASKAIVHPSHACQEQDHQRCLFGYAASRSPPPGEDPQISSRLLQLAKS